MPSPVKMLRVFVASPSDVVEERKKLKAIIDKVNKEIRSNSGVQFELIKWETDTSPDVGEYVQAVINKQIEEYDVFIGVFWKRFGTPTKKWGSGTEEEFEIAYGRHTMNPSIRLMLYFSERDRDESKVDQKQFKLVKKFQSKLKDRNVYWKSYRNFKEFETEISLNLHHIVNDYKKKKRRNAKKSITKNRGLLKNLESWKLLYEHDENGKQIEGSLDNLIEAVTKGASIRLRIHHSENLIQVMDAPLLTIENRVVHASDIHQISSMRNQDGNYVYQDKPYNYYLIVNSNGYFHARRIFLDGKERSVTTNKKHMAWIALMPKN